MSWLYFRLNESQKALDHANLALPIWREVKNLAGEATAYNNIASVYEVLGQWEKAVEYYERALQLWQTYGNRYGEAQALNNLGIAYFDRGQYQKALECYGRALQFWQTLGNQLEQAETLNNIGLIYGNTGDFQKALESYQRSLTLARAVGNRNSQSNVLHNLGVVSYSRGEMQTALEYFEQSLALSRTIGNRSREAGALAGIAHAKRYLGDLSEARAQMLTALEIIDELRTKIAGQELRTSFLASKNSAYEFYTDLLMQSHESQPSAGHDREALVVNERYRARSLLESLGEVRADIRQGVDPNLLQRERGLQQQLNAKAERLTRLSANKQSEEQAAAAKKEVDALLTEFQQVQTQIRMESPHYAALMQPQPLSVSEIQQDVLDQDSLLLEYSLGQQRSFLWAVTRDSISSYVLPKRGEIETAARRVYQLLTARNLQPESETPEQRTKRVNLADAEYRQAAAMLSEMLLGSVATQLGTKRLVIVTDGALQYVPFSALPAPSGGPDTAPTGDANKSKPANPHVSFVPLILKHEIITLPSASVLAVLRRELRGRTRAPESLAVLADPVFRNNDPRIQEVTKQRHDNSAAENALAVSQNGRLGASATDVESAAKESGLIGFKRLRFSRQEAEAITALAPGGKNLKAIDFTASKATATSPQLSRYRILHFATHGLLNNQQPDLSGIVLSLVDEQGRPQDGFLRLHEIYNLKLSADLVVLSACQTALGKDIKGEGLVGLTRGFMYAGAPRVVASLWNVDDRATSELMKRFYKAMFSQGKSPASALRAAQASLQSEKGWGAPYYWAAFTLQGEWK
jgi:CHAT domain-containing protein/tetratricopeptide (TPR) repeat protein